MTKFNMFFALDVQIKRQEVVFINLIEQNNFFLNSCVLNVIILQDRCNGTVYEREWDYTNYHDYGTEYSFKWSCAWYISITDSCDCRNAPIKARLVDFFVIKLFFSYKLVHPCIWVLRVWTHIITFLFEKLSNHDPETCHNMNQYEEHKNEEEESLEPNTDFEKVLKHFHEIGFVLHYF